MRLYLADLGHNQITISSDVYPLGVANLAAYAKAYAHKRDDWICRSRLMSGNCSLRPSSKRLGARSATRMRIRLCNCSLRPSSKRLGVEATESDVTLSEPGFFPNQRAIHESRKIAPSVNGSHSPWDMPLRSWLAFDLQV